MIAWLLASALAASPVGFRFDGSGAWPAAHTAVGWTAEGPFAWSTPLPTWSNASPVPFGALVCVEEEPVTLVCLDAATGRVAWRADHPITGALPTAQAAEVQAALDRAPALQAELDQLKATYGDKLRDARRTGAQTDPAALQALADRLEATKAELERIAPWRTPPDQGLIGWSAPTPVTDGTRLYALFGHGVVAAHTADGRAVWQHWQGTLPETMIGYEGGGQSASPALAGDVLVVPAGHLTGLDTATGAVRWALPEPWRHYGSPVVAHVDGLDVVLLPDGRVVRARDGAVVDQGLAEVWYVGPTVVGSRAWFVEARADATVRHAGGVTVKAVTLERDGDAVTHTQDWAVLAPVTTTTYAAPAVAGGRVYLVSHDRELVVLDADTGAQVAARTLDALAPYKVFASPAVAAGRVFVTSEYGTTVVLDAATLAPVTVSTTEPMRTSLAWRGDRLFLRTRDRVVALDPP